ncbi:MAG TPA: type II toxin-antitoxin system VapC family toxin [Terriglobales bacterium]|nr:type II toxin-antitoxin system VapC family toxin [Terriglobales bacterium]
MSKVVIDASVAMKWAFPDVHEELTDVAADLLRNYVDRAIQIAVPDIFWAELGNISWKGVRQGRWTGALAEAAVSEMQSRRFPTMPSKVLLSDALHIALDCDRSVYDSLYVALAVSTKAQLITADQRLANATAARFPVKWLGAVN